MKATKLPSGNYRVQISDGYTPNGKRLRKSFTAATAWEAMKMAEEYMQNKAIYRSGILTVKEAMKQYVASKSNVISPSTKRGYEIIINTRLQLIMDININELKSIDIQRAVNIDTERLCRKSIHSALALLKSALDFQDINISLKKITIPQKIAKDIELPEVNTIINIIIGTELELPCLLAMWLSLRVSEVRGLKFKDISADGKFLTVCRARMYLNGKDVVREQNKTTRSRRKNRLPEYIYDLIQNVPHNSDDDFIVQMGYNKIANQFKKLFTENGLEFMTFHKLRHVFATTTNELGIPDEYIQKLGGWSTNKVLKEVYTHTLQDSEERYQKIINDYFNDCINANICNSEKTGSDVQS